VLACVLLLVGAGQAQAGGAEEIAIEARVTGSIVTQTFCGPTTICQRANVTGLAWPLGPVSGVLDEEVDITTGKYVGKATFTLKISGATVTAEYTGQLSTPDAAGRVLFFEDQTVVGGTKSFANATGRLGAVGSATPDGKLTALVLGHISR
jgi:hypothetical protein